jgi:hypothetical protein
MCPQRHSIRTAPRTRRRAHTTAVCCIATALQHLYCRGMLHRDRTVVACSTTALSTALAPPPSSHSTAPELHCPPSSPPRGLLHRSGELHATGELYTGELQMSTSLHSQTAKRFTLKAHVANICFRCFKCFGGILLCFVSILQK